MNRNQVSSRDREVNLGYVWWRRHGPFPIKRVKKKSSWKVKEVVSWIQNLKTSAEVLLQERVYKRMSPPGSVFPRAPWILPGSPPFGQREETPLMHYILLTFPSTAILWGAYSNEVCVRFDRYFPVPNQRHGKAEEGWHHLQGRQEAVTGKLPIQVHLWRHWGRRQESVLSELMKPQRNTKQTCLFRVTFPMRRASVCASQHSAR